MANEDLGDLLNAVGQCVADIVGDEPDGSYLYVECNGRSCGAGVFRDEGDSVAYFDPDDDLITALYALWNATEADKKWEIMEYQIAGSTFNVQFTFPDQLEPDEFIHDRRERALRARYGDKPVIYPPIDGGFHELGEDDLSKD